MQMQLAEVIEAQCHQANRQNQAFAESVAKNGPAGSDAALAFNQLITLASTGQESAYKAAKQVVDFARNGLRTATGPSKVADVVDEEAPKSGKSTKP
jgi:hypothetical protein